MSNLLLSVIMATMASLSATMLGMGQRSAVLPALTLASAFCSAILTDWLGWFRLNRVIANVAMVLAAFFSLSGFMDSGSHQQLLAIASLLIYVQIVLLFQEKNRRIYGQLAMFSLLQVVVAALLNDSLEFGLLLALYTLLALFGFTLFFLVREVDHVGVTRGRRRVAEPESSDVVDGLRSLLGGPPVIEIVETRAALIRATVTRHFLQPILAMVVATLVFAIVFFYSTPRTGGANWDSGSGIRSVVGFSPEINFDEMGRVLQSAARVMRVSFTNARTGEPYTVIGEPYFRGGVLTKYFSADGYGQWRQEIGADSSSGLSLASPPNSRDLVRQDVLLEPTGDVTLFSLFPVYAIAETSPGIRINPRTRQLYRSGLSSRDLGDEFRFTVATTAFRFGSQIQVSPHPNKRQTAQDKNEMVQSLRSVRFMDSSEEFPKLIALADKIVREKAPTGDNYAKARALESHFLAQGAYHYSLNADEVNAKRNFTVDPIEDFVSNHHTGHCEYFASALTLMLRSQGIPARTLVGYKGGEFNYVGNYYVVRQRDAHAWVEAYLTAEEIPEDGPYPEERHAGGGWLRLDPTPSSDEEIVEDYGIIDRATKSFDYARWLWNDYVLRLTSERQKSAILSPLALDRQLPVESLVSMESWKKLAERVTGTQFKELAEGKFSCAGEWLR